MEKSRNTVSETENEKKERYRNEHYGIVNNPSQDKAYNLIVFPNNPSLKINKRNPEIGVSSKDNFVTQYTQYNILNSQITMKVALCY